ncbi:hypothetical protein JOQ06_017729 [Pogonophryne albipinna]|uniref:IRS-type PTB domain-containing protein n=1 Tax=Pogonophryne albipinna TaxID=1090488 RepID=A0AAD6A9S4_9TELE|nr:hypothetical protein JOQ06_017729 [Pogonophryne albipinna]
MWCVLFRESSCSISRLEFFECKDGGSVEKSDKTLRKQQEHKKVIRMSDCIRVSEVEVDGCPRDTGPFLIETTEKIYVFASERLQLEDWTHKLCEIAFPMSWPEGVKRGSLQRGSRVEEEVMEDNSLYSGRHTVRDFRVCVRRTEASDRCRLRGDRFLRADEDALLLLDKSGSSFSFEAGRRCDSGEGNFEFDTREGNFLFQAVEAAINLQRMPHPQRQSSGGGGSPETPRDLNPPLVGTPPLPQGRKHIPQCPAAQKDGVYSLDPLQYPKYPLQYPKDPLQYPKYPLQYPKYPLQYPKYPLQYPKYPLQYPKDPLQYPKDPLQYPKDPLQYPKDPLQYPKYPLQYPKDPLQYPKYPLQYPKYPLQYPKYPLQYPKYPLQYPKYPLQYPKYPLQYPKYPL